MYANMMKNNSNRKHPPSRGANASSKCSSKKTLRLIVSTVFSLMSFVVVLTFWCWTKIHVPKFIVLASPVAVNEDDSTEQPPPILERIRNKMKEAQEGHLGEENDGDEYYGDEKENDLQQTKTEKEIRLGQDSLTKLLQQINEIVVNEKKENVKVNSDDGSTRIQEQSKKRLQTRIEKRDVKKRIHRYYSRRELYNRTMDRTMEEEEEEEEGEDVCPFSMDSSFSCVNRGEKKDGDSKKTNDDDSNKERPQEDAIPPNQHRKAIPPMPQSRINHNKELIQKMYTHAYDSYMYNAYPMGELRPISCKGGKFNLIKLPSLTLLDTLDTFVLMGNYTEFARAVERLRLLNNKLDRYGGHDGDEDEEMGEERDKNYLFHVNENVSVFETNIRVLGGLLSAHQLAKAFVSSNAEDGVPLNHVFDRDDTSKVLIGPIVNHEEDKGTIWEYDGFLLRLSIDMGNRLLPAFDTDTGIPYGSVNLISGVPKGETKEASLAGAGTLTLEMELLSRLTGDAKYGKAAKLATKALWMRRSQHSLLGKHLSTQSGHWTETLSGIGSNADSFYEYLLKYYILFDDVDFWDMFTECYEGIWRHNRIGDFFGDVDMSFGRSSGTSNPRHSVVESLEAFWPGVQVLLGEIIPAGHALNALFMVREEMGFMPERFNFETWNVDSRNNGGPGLHPLRPELLESAYFMHRATRKKVIDDHNSTIPHEHGEQQHSHYYTSGWQWAADFAIQSIETLTRTECGYATVRQVQKDKELKLNDEMPSFFLSETLKYLYLMFDEDNVLHNSKNNNNNDIEWVFTTEAHPIHYEPKITTSSFADGPPLPETTTTTTTTQKGGGIVTLRDIQHKIHPTPNTNNHLKNNHNHHDTPQKPHILSALKQWTLEKTTNTKPPSFFTKIHSTHPNANQNQHENWAKRTTKRDFDAQMDLVRKMRFKRERRSRGDHPPSILYLHPHYAQKHHHRHHNQVHYSNHYITNTSQSLPSSLSSSRKGTYIKAPSNTILSDITSTAKFDVLGNGHNIARGCPNYDHAKFGWVHALAPDAAAAASNLDDIGSSRDNWAGFQYVERYQPRINNKEPQQHFQTKHRQEFCPVVGGTHKKGIKTGAANARTDTTTTTTTTTDLLDPTQQQPQQKQQPPKSQRFDGGDLGQFDVTIFEDGFIGQHVQTKERFEVNFVKGSDDKGYIFVVAKRPLELLPKDQKLTTAMKTRGHQMRALISDMKNNVFHCEVELFRTIVVENGGGEEEEKEEEVEEVDDEDQLESIATFPCSAANFGPTHLKELIRTDGLLLKGVMRAPRWSEETGCKEGDAARDEGIIQIVLRGECSFYDKITNQQRRHGARGVVVVNTVPEQLFVMNSGGGDDSENENYLEKREMYEQDRGMLPEPASVLLAKEDGIEVINILQRSVTDKIVGVVRVKPTEKMTGKSVWGNQLEWPHMTSVTGNMQIFATINWGIHAIQNGDEWQLIIVRPDT